MKRKISTRLLTCLLACAMLFLLTACTASPVEGKISGSGSTQTNEKVKKKVYKYKTKSFVDEFKLTKTKIEKNRVTLYYKGILGKDIKYWTYYDSDFKIIDGDFAVKEGIGKLTIKGENAHKISGLAASNDGVKLELRYLNSEQYQMLIYYEASDIGWVLSGGDSDAFYTKEEKDAFEAAKIEATRIQKENWEILKGKWSCENPATYVEFYENSEGRFFSYVFEGEEVTMSYIDNINIKDYFGECLRVDVVDNVAWGCQYTFELDYEKNNLSYYEQTFHREP